VIISGRVEAGLIFIDMAFFLMLCMLGTAALTAVSVWREAFRVFGPRAPALGLRVMRLRSRQRIRYGTFTFQLLFVVLAGAYFLMLFLTGRGSLGTGMPAAIAAVVLIQFAAPPSVVVLGTSTNEGRRLFSKVRRAVPGRSLSLLQSGVLDVIEGPSFTRTSDPAWQSTVRELMQIAPMIVVDARLTSAAVRQEVEWIVDSVLRHRTVFITADDGRDVVLQELRASRSDVSVDDLTVIPGRHIDTLSGRLSAGMAATIAEGP
jgi:hypothetical protein